MTCPECAAKDREIATLRILLKGAWPRVRFDRDPAPVAPPPPPLDLPPLGRGGEDFDRRRQAMLRALAQHPEGATPEEMQADFPAAPHLSGQQRQNAYQSVLHNLKHDGCIERRRTLWFLTPYGRQQLRAD